MPIIWHRPDSTDMSIPVEGGTVDLSRLNIGEGLSSARLNEEMATLVAAINQDPSITVLQC
jgi:hypothetical protein